MRLILGLTIFLLAVTSLLQYPEARVMPAKNADFLNPYRVPGKATIVSFRARWCSSCEAMRHIIEKQVSLHPTVRVKEIDVDEISVPGLRISSIPHLFIYDENSGFVGEVRGADEGSLASLLKKVDSVKSRHLQL